MQVMVGKRLLARDDAQRSHVYRPLLKPEATGRQMMGRLLDRVFAGSTSALVQQALDVGQVDQAELTEIRRLIDAHAARSAKGASGKGRP
jgi:predicted transcriptional regulator